MKNDNRKGIGKTITKSSLLDVIKTDLKGMHKTMAKGYLAAFFSAGLLDNKDLEELVREGVLVDD